MVIGCFTDTHHQSRWVASPSAQGQVMTSTETADNMVGRNNRDRLSVTIQWMLARKCPIQPEQNTGYLVNNALHGCFAFPCFLHHTDDAGKYRMFAYLQGFNNKRTFFWLMVPASTLSSVFLFNRHGSPLIMLSSTKESPSVSIPSTGICSPGRTTTRSFTWSSAMVTSASFRCATPGLFWL